MKVAIVSGCDANFYPLLRELIASIRQFEKADACDICVLDAGLLESQLSELSQLARHVRAPKWPAEISAKRYTGKDYLKACVCRPFINQLFPEYDMYVWLDADTWVQDWTAVEMFIEGAKSAEAIAITNGADRAYSKPVRVSWLGNWPRKIKNFYSSNGHCVFGAKFARQMVEKYVLSAGCFALHKSAPHWHRWQTLVVQAANKGKLFPAEQLALGKMIHQEGYKAQLLPAYMHWLCACKPMWDNDRKLFVEPFLPHEPLGVLHLSGVDHLRAYRSATTDIAALDGTIVHMNYRYAGFDGGPLAVAKVQRA